MRRPISKANIRVPTVREPMPVLRYNENRIAESGCRMTSLRRISRSVIPIVLAAIVLGVSTPVTAFDEADLERFRETGNCPGCDLSGANLIGIWSDGTPDGAGDLRGADLREATVSGIGYGFDFRGADLTAATATYMDFGPADFSGASLRDLRTYLTEFTGTILRGADLRNVGFRFSVDGADFRGADVSGADFTHGTITQEQLDVACGTDVTLPEGLTVAPCD